MRRVLAVVTILVFAGCVDILRDPNAPVSGPVARTAQVSGVDAERNRPASVFDVRLLFDTFPPVVAWSAGPGTVTSWVEIDGSKATAYRDGPGNHAVPLDGVGWDRSFSYRVAALNVTNVRAESEVFEARTPRDPGGPRVEFPFLAKQDNNQLTLHWKVEGGFRPFSRISVVNGTMTLFDGEWKSGNEYQTETIGPFPPGAYIGYQITARDGAGRWFGSSLWFTTLPSSDTKAPVVTEFHAEPVSATEMKINWKVSDDGPTTSAPTSIAFAIAESDYHPLGSMSSSRSSVSEYGWGGDTKIMGLKPGGLYHVLLRSKDASGNLVYTPAQLVQMPGKSEHDPPLISNISITDISHSSAQVRWDISDASPVTSYVSYTSHGFASGGSFADGPFGDAPELHGLTANETIKIRIRASDANGNVAESSTFEFRTLEAEILVGVNGDQFSQQYFTSSAGSRVKWLLVQGNHHLVIERHWSEPAGTELLNTTFADGPLVSLPIVDPGEYSAYCRNHTTANEYGYMVGMAVHFSVRTSE